MFMLDKPFISRVLLDTAMRLNVPVLETADTKACAAGQNVPLVPSRTFSELAHQPGARLYSNSENALAWVADNMADTDLPAQVEVFKNKARFREIMQPEHPELFFCTIPFDDLSTVDLSQFPDQFVIKPAVGFFSLGVHVITNHDQWGKVVSLIQNEIAEMKRMFPVEVVDSTTFLAEGIVEGDEYAIDLYYDSSGEPVILNILHHKFASASDTSDRLYLCSYDIISQNLERFTHYLKVMGKRCGSHDIPMHVELRMTPDGTIAPIEVNPLRFAGWCTADMPWYGLGYNEYEYYLNKQTPDWEQLFAGKKDSSFVLSVLTHNTTTPTRDVTSFDYQGFSSRFTNPFKLRKVDWKEHGFFGFLFAEVPAGKEAELDFLLHTDLGEFMQV